MDELSRIWLRTQRRGRMRDARVITVEDLFADLIELAFPCDFQRIPPYGNPDNRPGRRVDPSAVGCGERSEPHRSRQMRFVPHRILHGLWFTPAACHEFQNADTARRCLAMAVHLTYAFAHGSSWRVPRCTAVRQIESCPT